MVVERFGAWDHLAWYFYWHSERKAWVANVFLKSWGFNGSNTFPALFTTSLPAVQESGNTLMIRPIFSCYVSLRRSEISEGWRQSLPCHSWVSRWAFDLPITGVNFKLLRSYPPSAHQFKDERSWFVCPKDDFHSITSFFWEMVQWMSRGSI